jgi:hypothetical protein
MRVRGIMPSHLNCSLGQGLKLQANDKHVLAPGVSRALPACHSLAARRRQVESARSASTLSRARYDGGVTSYLEVLDTERSLFNAELAESQTLRLYFNSIIELYKALGGGWAPES